METSSARRLIQAEAKPLSARTKTRKSGGCLPRREITFSAGQGYDQGFGTFDVEVKIRGVGLGVSHFGTENLMNFENDDF
jgi:hypothetical protein